MNILEITLLIYIVIIFIQICVLKNLSNKNKLLKEEIEVSERLLNKIDNASDGGEDLSLN